jgi:hypothetical protein
MHPHKNLLPGINSGGTSDGLDNHLPQLICVATDVEKEKQAELRKLGLVIGAYLQGEGHIEKRRRLFRQELPVLRTEVDGYEWRLADTVRRLADIKPAQLWRAVSVAVPLEDSSTRQSSMETGYRPKVSETNDH